MRIIDAGSPILESHFACTLDVIEVMTLEAHVELDVKDGAGALPASPCAAPAAVSHRVRKPSQAGDFTSRVSR
jgi:hypothetical protein